MTREPIPSKPADSGRVDAKEYLDNCVNALDHIARTARNCRVTSKRLTWIASRAESAINSNDAWRDAPVPKNGTSALLRAQARIKELEAALAAQGQGEHIGEAGSMPGTGGFTMACFRAEDVPVGTKLYANPAPPASPAGVPDGWSITPEADPLGGKPAMRLRGPSGISALFGGFSEEVLTRDFLAALIAPSAPEGDGGGE